MEELDDKKFDLELRAVFENAGEEVPGHVWDAVEKRLDKIGRRRIFPIWLRNTGYSVAAAAAILLTLVFTGTFNTRTGQTPTDEMIAVVAPQHDSPSEDFAVHDTSEDAAVIATAADGRTAMLPLEPAAHTYIAQAAGPSESTAEIAGDAAGQSPSSSARPSELPSGKSSITGKARREKWVDPFAFEEDDSDRAKVAFTFNGNSSGINERNESPSGGPLRTSSIRRPRKVINETGSSSYAIPVSFGIGAKVSLSPKWSIGAGVSYTLLSRTFQGTYSALGSDGVPGEPIKYPKIRNSQSYIGIPVNVYYSIINNKRLDFYAYAGGTAEKCVDNRYRMAQDVIYKEAVKGFQFSAGGGIGVEFIFGDMLGLYIDPNVRYWFKDGRQPKSIRTQNPLSFGCEIGFRVRL